MIGGNLAFGMDGRELTNQHPAHDNLQEILWEMAVGNPSGNLVGNAAGNSIGQNGGQKPI